MAKKNRNNAGRTAAKESKLDLSKIALVILIGFAAVAIFLVANNFAKGGNEFQGDIQKTETSYVLDFQCLDQADSHQIAVSDGDKLHCSFDITEGAVDFSITCNGERLYNSGKVENGEFDVVVKEGGNATVYVRGTNAAGKISVTKA